MSVSIFCNVLQATFSCPVDEWIFPASEEEGMKNISVPIGDRISELCNVDPWEKQLLGSEMQNAMCLKTKVVEIQRNFFERKAWFVFVSMGWKCGCLRHMSRYPFLSGIVKASLCDRAQLLWSMAMRFDVRHSEIHKCRYQLHLAYFYLLSH